MTRKTGGSNDYYVAQVKRTIDGRAGYTVQCLEVIETLGMTFAEGEAFKAIWRSCAARTLGKEKADNTALYDAEKVEFYGKRMVAANTPISQYVPIGWAPYTEGQSDKVAPWLFVDAILEDGGLNENVRADTFNWGNVIAYRLRPSVSTTCQKVGCTDANSGGPYCPLHTLR